MVAFTAEGMKDSVANAMAQGEFVYNLATLPLAQATSARVAPGVSEFELAALTPVPSRLVAPPRVAESPAAFECVVTSTQELMDRTGTPTGQYMVIGQVVGVHIDDACLVNGLFDTVAANPLTRCGYRDYAVIASVFQMTRPDEKGKPAG